MPKDKKPGLYERNKGKIIGAGITTALNSFLKMAVELEVSAKLHTDTVKQ